MRIWTVLRRGLAARTARTAATGVAVAAAVAFLAGSYVLTDTIDAGVQRSATQATSGVPVIVTDTRGFGNSGLFGAPTLPPGLVDRIRQIPGVGAAEGVTEGYAMPLNGHGRPTSTLTGIGLSIPADPRLRMLQLVTGTWPAGPGQVVVDTRTASNLHLKPGDTLRVALASGVRSFAVSGTTTFGGADDVVGLSVVGFTPSAAAGLLGSTGSYAAVEAAPAPGVDSAALQDRVENAVGGDYTVRTGAQQAGQLIDAAGGVASLIGTFLRAFAVIALFVSALLIANTFTITVAQRTRELALLRCIGAARNQTARLILAEAVLVGAVGGIVGLPGGIGLAVALEAVLGAFGLPLPGGSPVVAAHTIVAALAVGIGVTAGAAGGAAARASRSRPLTALTTADTTADAPRPGRVRTAVAGLLLLGGAVLLGTGAALPPVGLGAIALLLGAGLAGPALVRPLTAPIRAVLGRVAGFAGRLAGRQMLRAPRRVAGTTGALAVSVATVSIVAALAATVSASDAFDVRRSLHADFVVSASPQALLDPSLAGRVAATPGVTGTAAVPCGIVKFPGDSERACGIDPATFERYDDLHVTSGSLADLTTGTIAVSTLSAERVGWRLGQTVPVTFPVGGTRQVRVAALFDDEEVAGSYLISATDYAQNFPTSLRGDHLILVSTTATDLAAVHTALAALLADYPQASLDDEAGFIQRTTSGIDLLMTMMTGLLALSLLIGLLSVTTSLALSVLERTRETGLLRAIGAETRQIKALIRAEALATVTTGTAVGALLGLAIGWPLARAIMLGHLHGGPAAPTTLLVIVIPAAAVAGLLAAAVPARRAARLDVLESLAAY